MNLFEWLSLALVCFLGAATPGPSLAVILGHTYNTNATAGRMASLSHAFAIFLYALGTILGLSKLFIAFPVIAKSLTLLGALYLLYLSANILLSAQKLNRSSDEGNLTVSDPKLDITKPGAKSYKNAIAEAFFIGFLNPKLAFFFLALFSQFIPSENMTLGLASILLSTVFFIDLFWYLFVVSIAIQAKNRLTASPTIKVWLLRIQALIFILIAANSVIWH
ncbi:LysE family transporter [Psychrosphaera sp.]|nr:LysE family transporter [Psychrosphaera sp.]